MTDGLSPDVAAAVLDGAPIDWNAAEAGMDETRLPVIRELRILAALADCHRSFREAESHPPNRLPALEQWGHLRVLEPVGHGAFGDVYRAWDTRLDREVALKLLAAPRSSNGDPASTIIEEGQLLARVRHPNVVTIHGAEQIADRIGLWMEFVHPRRVDDPAAFVVDDHGLADVE